MRTKKGVSWITIECKQVQSSKRSRSHLKSWHWSRLNESFKRHYLFRPWNNSSEASAQTTSNQSWETSSANLSIWQNQQTIRTRILRRGIQATITPTVARSLNKNSPLSKKPRDPHMKTRQPKVIHETTDSLLRVKSHSKCIIPQNWKIQVQTINLNKIQLAQT